MNDTNVCKQPVEDEVDNPSGRILVNGQGGLPAVEGIHIKKRMLSGEALVVVCLCQWLVVVI